MDDEFVAYRRVGAVRRGGCEIVLCGLVNGKFGGLTAMELDMGCESSGMGRIGLWHITR